MSKLQLIVIMSDNRHTKSSSRLSQPHMSLPVTYYRTDIITLQITTFQRIMFIGFRICNQFIRIKDKYNFTRANPYPSVAVLTQRTGFPLSVSTSKEMAELILSILRRNSQIQTSTERTYPHTTFTVFQHTKDIIR